MASMVLANAAESQRRLRAIAERERRFAATPSAQPRKRRPGWGPEDL